MTSTPWSQLRFESHEAFYRHVYGHYRTQLRPAGRTGTVMMQVEQHAGDCSDAPTPDLVVARLLGPPVASSIDLGHGRFEQLTQEQRHFIVAAPEGGTSIQMRGEHVCQFLAVPYRALRQLCGDELLPSDGDFGPLHSGLQADAEVSALLDRLWHEGQAGDPHGALLADGLLLQLAAALLRLRGPAAGARAPRGGLAPFQLRRVQQYLDEHLADDVALADLASVTGLSASHLCRAFRQSTGLPPHRWRLARRMERARELLEQTQASIGDIAALIGYDDPGQLAVAFRQRFGISPSRYRRERRT